MIMMPLFGDQLSNAAILADLGVGERLMIQNLTKEQLEQTINKVVNDKGLELPKLSNFNKNLHFFEHYSDVEQYTFAGIEKECRNYRGHSRTDP